MTSTQMPSAISMPCPFANPIDGSTATVTEVSKISSETTVNFQKGFGSGYSAPSSAGGKYVTRGEMNGIGKALGTDTFRARVGAINTFDPELAAAIGGYPKGAILKYVSGNNIYDVISLQDSNLTDFNSVGVDNVWWRMMNFALPESGNEIVVGSVSNAGKLCSIIKNVDTVAVSDCAEFLSGFRCDSTGIIYLKNISFDFDSSSNHFMYDFVTTINAVVGCGYIYKDVGTNPSALENLAMPTPTNSNGWKQFGAAGISLRGVTVSRNTSTQIVSTVTNWDMSGSLPVIQKGHYIALGIVYGTSDVSLSGQGTASLTQWEVKSGSADVYMRII